MTSEIFCICDTATGKNGQLCILHTFNDWISQANPAQINGMAVAQIRCWPEDEGEHTICLKMIDADGEEAWHTEEAKGYPRVTQWSSAWIVMFGFTPSLPPGQYEVQLIVDGAEMASIPFGVQPHAVRIS
jgi:hypothetical protein